ncbi:MAG: hypothetical protein ACI9R3_002195 [Verrucomicrobiales bacterium]|jgi:hypothetical protein
MKTLHFPKSLAASALLLLSAVPSMAVNIVISASDTSEIEAFLGANYTDAVVTAAGNFANFSSAESTAALAAGGGADLMIIGRSLSSGDYGAFNAQGYNSLTIPVLNFTSYTARNAGDRMGWHVGSASADKPVAGAETTLTEAGAAMLGLPVGDYDFFDTNAGGDFNGLGTGTFGGGAVLATIGGDVLAAYWATGDAPGDTAAAGVDTFPGERLLLNLDDDPRPTGEFTAQTALGLQVYAGAIGQFGGLTAVPEPSTGLLGLIGAGMLALRRRR